ncbi:MAG: hypothetical protein FWG88_05960 [Oscillospiraceae bacterium]|nr:hypothetical protein [Oscillospiraceae bacterium]
MLINRDIEPSCSYCHHGTALGRNEYACKKRGIMQAYGFCGSFRYDPTRRIPKTMPKINASEYDKEDFSL